MITAVCMVVTKTTVTLDEDISKVTSPVPLASNGQSFSSGFLGGMRPGPVSVSVSVSGVVGGGVLLLDTVALDVGLATATVLLVLFLLVPIVGLAVELVVDTGDEVALRAFPVAVLLFAVLLVATTTVVELSRREVDDFNRNEVESFVSIAVAAFKRRRRRRRRCEESV